MPSALSEWIWELHGERIATDHDEKLFAASQAETPGFL
jgi:hypothetical protein